VTTIETAVNAFWYGPRLGVVHAACLRSFMRHGYRVVLHVYEPPEDVPAGIELFDAAKLMSRDRIVPYRGTESFSFAANLYRYRILQAGLGYYVDCDIFCLKPLPEADYVFGWEDLHLVNNAVLKAPADSELVRRLVEMAEDRSMIPPWFERREQRRLKWRRRLGRPVHPSAMRWGTTGPGLLSYLVKELGLQQHALPIDTFYPLHYNQIALLTDPGLSLHDLVTPRTVGLHLYNANLKDPVIPPGSPLAEVVST
jgi:hypothetical protein